MNPNILLAQCFVDELAQAGVRHVCISPGSRSTPLTLAFYQNPNYIRHPLLDERSAAFFALGLALAGAGPVALVCTSGSAAANYFPAIVEARMSHIPLLILTADRPPELRGSGANQTIDQLKLYGDMVLWSMDMPVPGPDLSSLVERHVRTLAARAFAVADGIQKGPVHLNFPFRIPLEPPGPADLPTPAAAALPPLTRIEHGRIAPGKEQTDRLVRVVQTHPRGLIVCGPQSILPPGFARAIHAFSRVSGYPILADPLSGVRFSPEQPSPWLIAAYEALLSAVPEQCPPPQVVFRFGAVPTAAPLATYLDQSDAIQILIDEGGHWADDTHRLSGLLQVNPVLLVEEMVQQLTPYPLPTSSQEFSRSWQALERTAQDVLSAQLAQRPLFDAAIIEDLLSVLPDPARLFVGNSLAIRHVDRFARPAVRHWQLLGTRGASGIDGNLSTALGIAASSVVNGSHAVPSVALLGDVALLHDLNALHIPGLADLKDVTILVNNNNGGGIFHRLPIHRFEPPFTEVFLLPHNLRFEHAAAMFGLEYSLVQTRSELQAALARRFSTTPGRAALIEVLTDSTADLEHNTQVLQALAHRLRK